MNPGGALVKGILIQNRGKPELLQASGFQVMSLFLVLDPYFE
jgi:hypothetical protein